MNNIFRYSDIDLFIDEYKDSKNGCLVDTNTLIAWSFGSHEFAEDAEFIFEKLADHSIPIYCNVNIRAEFLEYTRRLLITEGILSIYAQAQTRNLHPKLKNEFGRIRFQQRKAEEKNRTHVINDSQIKKYRKEMDAVAKNSWKDFCKEFLIGSLEKQWQEIYETMGLNFLEVRENDISDMIPKKVTWKSLVTLMEQTGAASNDAMVLNLLEKSKPMFLITTDSDFAYNAKVSNMNKFVFLPQNHSYWSQ